MFRNVNFMIRQIQSTLFDSFCVEQSWIIYLINQCPPMSTNVSMSRCRGYFMSKLYSIIHNDDAK